MKKTFFKSIAILLFVATLAPTAYLLAPQKAEAQVGIIGCIAGALGLELAGTTTAAIIGAAGAVAGVVVPVFDVQPLIPGSPGNQVATNTGALTFKECVLDGLIWVAKEIIISGITASILEWIQSGFEGAPTFVTDFGGFMTGLADSAAAAFILGDEFAFLCDAFQGSLQLSIAINYSQKFRDRIDCTLSDVVANIGAFIDGFEVGFDVNGNSVVDRNTFRRYGGWNEYQTMALNPSNNPFGAYLQAEEELYASIFRRNQVEMFKIDIGGGYASISSCLARDESGKCLRSEIPMPGKFVESYIANAIGWSGLQRLGLADEIDEILGALLEQLITMVLEQGVGLLNGGSQVDGGGTSFSDRLRAAQDLRDRQNGLDGQNIQPAIISNVQPQGVAFPAGTTQITMSATTNEAATCKYGPANVAYAALPNTFQTTGGTSHSTTLTTADGQTRAVYIRCQDTDGDVNAQAAVASFTVGGGVVGGGTDIPPPPGGGTTPGDPNGGSGPGPTPGDPGGGGTPPPPGGTPGTV